MLRRDAGGRKNKGDGMKRGSTQLVTGRRLAAALAVLLLAGAAALAQRKQTKPPKGQKAEASVRLPDDQAIDVAISEMLAAWQLGEVEVLHKYYADDVMVVSGAWEPPLMGWANFLRAYQNQRERMQNARLDRSNTYANARGNLAWAVYQWDFSAVVDGKPLPARGHTTLILEKRKDRWVIIHNHTSIVPEIKEPVSAPPPGAPKPPPASAGAGDRAG